MSMQGIGGAGLPPWLRGPAETGQTGAPDAGSTRPGATESGQAGQAGRTAPSRVQQQRPAPPSTPAPTTAPDAAPEGVDTELWSLLTTEERAHFARFQAMGGVTYGPGAARPTRPSVQGHRLDLRI